MARSTDITVTASKRATTLIIDPPSVASGLVPFGVTISGMLIDAQTGGGIAGATVNVYANNKLIGAAWTNSNPYAGAIGVWWVTWTVKEVGTYSIHAEFAGDATYEGCDEINDVVTGLGVEGAPPTPPTPTVEIGGLALIALLFLGGLALAKRKPEKG